MNGPDPQKARETGPVLIELEAGDAPALTPAEAPPVPDPDLPGASLPGAPGGSSAMTRAVNMAARRPSRLGRWALSLALALVGFMASLAAWDFVNRLIERNPVLGMIALGLSLAFVLVLVAIALREWLGFVRLGRIDKLRLAGEAARAGGDLDAARAVVDRLARLYRDRAEAAWGRDRLAARRGEVFEPADLIDLAETELLAPLDHLARAEVERAARQVATVTAIVPLALADVATALTANLRMIRRIAEIYGGRAGLMGSWRLTRAVMSHLVATGAVAVGDDMIGSVAGGSVLSKISRRFGEGVVNGALTARVGVAAMDVCRPLPFAAAPRPSVSAMVGRALKGLFGR